MITVDGQWVPDLMNIELSDGDWVWGQTAPFALPSGTTGRVEWDLSSPITWNAVIDGDDVSWRQDKATCTAAIIPQGTRYQMFLSYPNDEHPEDPDEYVWKHGRAMRTPNRV